MPRFLISSQRIREVGARSHKHRNVRSEVDSYGTFLTPHPGCNLRAPNNDVSPSLGLVRTKDNTPFTDVPLSPGRDCRA